jgi:hypothetical protein
MALRAVSIWLYRPGHRREPLLDLARQLFGRASPADEAQALPGRRRSQGVSNAVRVLVSIPTRMAIAAPNLTQKTRRGAGPYPDSHQPRTAA